MAPDADSCLPGVARPYLAGLLREALAAPALDVLDWEAQPLHGGSELASAVFRLQGHAEEGGQVLPWSLILKVVRPLAEAADPQGIWYSRREALGYGSGLLHRLPGKLTAPRCYAVREQPDGSTWLWLEDVPDEVGDPWPLAHYGVVARHLGQFNGAYLAGEPLPSEAWVARDWLRRYVEHAAPQIEFIRRNPTHPIVQSQYPGNNQALVLGLWDQRGPLLDLLDRLPQAFCHQDAFRRNLFARGGQTVAIDWGYAGPAPVGAELAALIFASLMFFEVPAAQAQELDRICFAGYLQGLRDAGWRGNPRLVRLAYTLTCMLRYVIGATVGEGLPTLLSREGRTRLETVMERPAQELERSDPRVVAYLQALFVEALKLMGVRRALALFGGIVRESINLRSKRA